MTKTNVQSTPSNSQHHDTPNNKTHVIKFRVTAEEKASLELTCKLLNLSLSTFIRRAMEIILPSRSSSSTQPVSMLNLQALSSYFMFVSFLPYGTFTVVTFVIRFF